MHVGHTHISSSRANDRFPLHKCVQRHAQRKQEHSTQPGSTAGHEHMHAWEAPRAHDPPFRAEAGTSALETTCDRRAREAQFGATDRNGAMIMPIKSTKTAIRGSLEKMTAARCGTHHDGLHGRSGLDGTDELRGDQQRIKVILSDAETTAPWRPARRGSHSSQRPDPASKRSFLPHSPPSLSLHFGQA